MEQKEKSMDMAIRRAVSERTVFPVGMTGARAAMQTVADTTDIIGSPSGTVTTMAVPGTDGRYRYVPFGEDDQLPYRLIDAIGADEVTSQNKLFNVLTCYGSGLEYRDRKTGKRTEDAEIERFVRANAFPQFFLEQATDMKYFYFSVAVVILNREGTRINRIRHKEACFCRLEAADRLGRINHVFYGNWQDGQAKAGEVETIPLLDFYDPLGDLLARMGRQPDAMGRMRRGMAKERKFGVLMRFPTPGATYYPIPYYTAIFRGGSYDEKRMISVGKRAKLKNATSIKYQVNINYEYWRKLIDEEHITDPEQAQKRIKREKENIRDFLLGLENQDKVWMTGFYTDPNGKEQMMVKIENLEGQKAGGDWNDDIQAAANTICYGDNIHPNLVGAVPGKSQANNSGSDKRELFTMKQALEQAVHDTLFPVHDLVIGFNGWADRVRPAVAMIMLTTLDSHADAKRVNPAEGNAPSESNDTTII